uniref:Uncharacterized protein n=1 Tax=Sus scrofa TaxID=9823 RepID=A0A8D1SEQ6_PIG
MVYRGQGQKVQKRRRIQVWLYEQVNMRRWRIQVWLYEQVNMRIEGGANGHPVPHPTPSTRLSVSACFA